MAPKHESKGSSKKDKITNAGREYLLTALVVLSFLDMSLSIKNSPIAQSPCLKTLWLLLMEKRQVQNRQDDQRSHRIISACVGRPVFF